jgi:hypothetical protein
VDNGPRQQIIDSAFKMTEELVRASTQLAEKIVNASQSGRSGRGGQGKSKALREVLKAVHLCERSRRIRGVNA